MLEHKTARKSESDASFSLIYPPSIDLEGEGLSRECLLPRTVNLGDKKRRESILSSLLGLFFFSSFPLSLINTQDEKERKMKRL